MCNVKNGQSDVDYEKHIHQFLLKVDRVGYTTSLLILLVKYYSITSKCCKDILLFKGIVHFEIHFWYVLAYLKGIQDVGVTVFSILINLGQTVRVYHSYHGGLWSPPKRACTEKSKLNMI